MTGDRRSMSRFTEQSQKNNLPGLDEHDDATNNPSLGPDISDGYSFV